MSKLELNQDRRGIVMTMKSPRGCECKGEMKMVLEVERKPIAVAAGIAVLVAVAL
ncbi:DNA topoisomerase 3-beta [Pyrenophora tritici-repentis]|uniref:Uncharacterized protein n=1 Tax=Pyrenophora tritici-repentis TaxID=45151 RepID=A0A317A456_9PLEO|nr:DNA topoisomerase 3-beta [Pyrenophora tritici-repentis]KAF7571498.1 hypothetical protein PtrM4_089980 [Pyrenophora tritici-repentis]KAI0579243.1 DNA topoisomerase 3-beta [Pyrenophora tritici-repentis]KAI1548377.1 DNA topoisomerase III [Pyrenophora tritici-repentis]PWO29791.1 Acs, Acyl-coenzyme A synthetaseAMP-(fatty) acid ligase [Pyrenophora tritici-repentis]